jgi:tetratricopeptide (TPR) repeat protein
MLRTASAALLLSVLVAWTTPVGSEAADASFELMIGQLNQDWVPRDTFFHLVVWENFIDAMSKEGLQQEYRASLDVSLHDDRGGAGSAVAVARYFLGDHLLKMGQPAQALEVVLQATGLAARQGWLLAVIEARALHALGRKAEAMIAAEQAVECAPGHKAEELQRELASILAERIP